MKRIKAVLVIGALLVSTVGFAGRGDYNDFSIEKGDFVKIEYYLGHGSGNSCQPDYNQPGFLFSGRVDGGGLGRLYPYASSGGK